jgi:Flp pilus assembly protein TadG
MSNSIKSILKRLRRDASGNVLMLTGLAMPVLVGGAGLAVDVSQWYMWRRELQFAADQAAMSGAYALSHGRNEQQSIARAEDELESNEQIVNFLGTPVITVEDHGTGAENAVQVTLSAAKTLPFSSILIGSAPTVSVSAKAAFESTTTTTTYDSCLISTATTGSSTINLWGNGNINLGCGIAALSTDSAAITIGGSAEVNVTSIVSAGGVSYTPGNLTNSTGTTILTNAAGLSDPYAGLSTPTNTTSRSYSCTGRGSNRTANLQPGTYDDGFTVSCNTTLSPGVYVIDGGEVKLNGNNTLSGSGVVFVLKNGATIDLNGTSSVSLTGLNSTQQAGLGLADPRYEGLLVYQDPATNTAVPAHNVKTVKINGNNGFTLGGTVYIPNGNVWMNGNANVSSHCLLLMGYTIEMTGSLNISNFCPNSSSVNSSNVEDNISVATTNSDVRLVA